MIRRIAACVAVPAFIIAAAAGPGAQARAGSGSEHPSLAGKDIDFEDEVLVIESGDEDWVVEVTADYELHIDGERIATDRDQRSLLRRYYRQAQEIEDLAREIAGDGADIGLEGARVGAKAIANLARLLLEEYDVDDLDRDIEADSRQIERMAKRIEHKAERLDSLLDDLDALHRKVRRAIPELDDLRGF